MGYLNGSRSNFLRFFGYVKPHWQMTLQAGVCMIFAIIPEIIAPFILMFVIDDLIVTGNHSFLFVLVAGLMIFRILQGFSRYVQVYLLEILKQKVTFKIRLNLFKKLEKLSVDFFCNRGSGYLSSRIFFDSHEAQGLLGDTILSFLRNLFTLVLGLTATFALHWKLSLVSLVFLFLFAVSQNIFSRKLRYMSMNVQERNAQLMKDMQECLSGIYIIKAFVLEFMAARRIVRTLKEVIHISVERNLLGAFCSILAGVVACLAGAAVILYGGSEVIAGRLTVGRFVAFNALLALLLQSSQGFVNLNILVQNSLGAIDRIFEFVDCQAEETSGKKELGCISSNIVFDNVSFSYESNGNRVLDHVNLEIPLKRTTAIVGKSGVGKTTLVNLLLAFHRPSNGKILINGIDISDVALKSLRKEVGLVSQDPFLWSASIAENIRFGKLNASDEEIIQAADMACAKEFIERLPQRYETSVGERGIKLSAGQRQRITLARAILRNPQVLILDEATSQIDFDLEQLILSALQSVTIDRTLIVIGHRLSTIRDADKIAVLDEGRIIAEGKHYELYKSCEEYRSIFCDQLREEQVITCNPQK
ncbi:ABC transporter ATP-binding protein [candidate division WOR-3 bacterium]|nr:ABC transporter ATP-binding protein [candidate division WOR-3 bacterium]